LTVRSWRLLLVARDITLRVLAQQAAQDRECEFETWADHLPDNIIRDGPDLRAPTAIASSATAWPPPSPPFPLPRRPG
jgi:hypothetical protein